MFLRDYMETPNKWPPIHLRAEAPRENVNILERE